MKDVEVQLLQIERGGIGSCQSNAERSFCVGIARVYTPSNCVFLLSHLSHPLKNGAI